MASDTYIGLSSSTPFPMVSGKNKLIADSHNNPRDNSPTVHSSPTDNANKTNVARDNKYSLFDFLGSLFDFRDILSNNRTSLFHSCNTLFDNQRSLSNHRDSLMDYSYLPKNDYDYPMNVLGLLFNIRYKRNNNHIPLKNNHYKQIHNHNNKNNSPDLNRMFWIRIF